MKKLAWRSFWASLHPRHLRKAYDNGAWIQILYWFVIYPIIMNAVSDNLEFYNLTLLMFMRMIPFLVMGWSNLNSKYLMPKAMYLSPMKEQERMEYINYVLLIKIGVAILLGMCIEIIWGIFTGFHLEKVLIAGLLNLSIGVATYLSSKKQGMNTFVLVVAVLTMAFIAFLEMGTDGGLTIFSNYFIAIALVVLVVCDILIVRKKYYTTIVLTGNYELAFKIEGKVEPQQVKFDLFAKKE